MTHTAQHSTEPATVNNSADADTQEIMAAVEAQLQRAVAAVDRTVKDNPGLAIAGAIAAGAVAGLLITNARQRNAEGTSARLRRDFNRHARELRRTVRNELDASGANTMLNNVSRSLGSVDLAPYIGPYIKSFVDQASKVAADAKSMIPTK